MNSIFRCSKEFGFGTVFQVSYMGALGRDLPNAININYNPNLNTATPQRHPQWRESKA